MPRQILPVTKKRKEQLKNARKKKKIKNGIGVKKTKGEEGVPGEAGTRGSGDGLGESACPELQDETVSRCQETTSNNDDGTTGSLRVVVITVLLSSSLFSFYLWTNNSIRGVFVCWSVCLSVMTTLKSVKTCIHDVAVMIVYGSF